MLQHKQMRRLICYRQYNNIDKGVKIMNYWYSMKCSDGPTIQKMLLFKFYPIFYYVATSKNQPNHPVD